MLFLQYTSKKFSEIAVSWLLVAMSFDEEGAGNKQREILVLALSNI